MKKVILSGILVVSLASFGFAQRAGRGGGAARGAGATSGMGSSSAGRSIGGVPASAVPGPTALSAQQRIGTNVGRPAINVGPPANVGVPVNVGTGANVGNAGIDPNVGVGDVAGKSRTRTVPADARVGANAPIVR